MSDFTKQRKNSRGGTPSTGRRGSSGVNKTGPVVDYKFSDVEEPPKPEEKRRSSVSRLFAPTSNSKSRKEATHARRQSFGDIMKPLKNARRKSVKTQAPVKQTSPIVENIAAVDQQPAVTEIQQHKRAQSFTPDMRIESQNIRPSRRSGGNKQLCQPVSQIKKEPGIDTWDSVKEQAQCTVCNMVFKTEWKYDRHMQFSQLHERNLERSKNPYGMIAKEIEVEKSKFEARLVYSGSKYFWRQAKTMDVTIHQYDCIGKKSFIQIIPYDVDVEKESKHFFLDYAKILDIIDKKELMKQSKEFYDNLPLNKKNSVGEEHTYQEKLRQTVVTFCMARLQMDDNVETDEDEPNEPVQLKFVKLQDDTYETVELATHPLIKEPKVLRRRRSSLDEFNASFSKLVLENDKLANSVNDADRYAGMAEKALDYLSTIERQVPAS